ncbi:MAG: hypothetical protein O7G87_12790 [bacterium]|nr:hypothetical protein [bacterium]
MNLRPIRFLLIWCPAIALFACGNSYLKNAEKHLEAGNPETAAELYLKALEKDPGNEEARIGLIQTTPLLVSRRSARAEALYLSQNDEAAYREYDRLFAFQKRAEQVGVHTPIQTRHLQHHQNAKQNALQKIYDQGTALLTNEDYAAAEAAFKRLLNIQSPYKDAQALHSESIYRQGLALFTAKQWRKAHRIFQQIGAYKDTQTYLQECLEKGRITIAFVPPQDRAFHKGNAYDLLYAAVLSNLLSRKDPFMHYIETPTIEQVLIEQHRQRQADSRLNQFLNADYTLKITVQTVQLTTDEDPDQASAWSWDGSTKEVAGENNQKILQAVNVKETYVTRIEGTKTATLKLNIQITHAPSGAIKQVRDFQTQKKSTIRYARYNGNLDHLYEREPNANRPKRYRADKNEFKPKRYTTDEKLIRNCVKALTANVANFIARID